MSFCCTISEFSGRAGVGVDNIDLDSASARGIFVVNSPNGNTYSKNPFFTLPN